MINRIEREVIDVSVNYLMPLPLIISCFLFCFQSDLMIGTVRHSSHFIYFEKQVK